MRLYTLAALSTLLLAAGLGASDQKSGLRTPPLIDRAEGEREGRALVADLLSRKPDKVSVSTGSIRIRGADRKERELSVRFEISSGPTNWISRYEVLPSTADEPRVKLSIVHTDGQPGEYWVEQGGEPARKLSSADLYVPLAGSDFWMADLGMEFLRWPGQRVLRKELRKSMSCQVLESTNPDAGKHGYGRVVAWVDPESGGIIHADAYDSSGGLLKQFDPSGIGKVNGIRQLEEMEMHNRKTGSHTWIRFNLKAEK